MRVVAKKILREFWQVHADSEENLKTWYKEAINATWNSPNDIKNEYARVSILKNNRAIFDICGNKYRLIVRIQYKRQWIFIRFIGTHNEYNKVDANNI